jgi:hypothetical protein
MLLVHGMWVYTAEPTEPRCSPWVMSSASCCGPTGASRGHCCCPAIRRDRRAGSPGAAGRDRVVGRARRGPGVRQRLLWLRLLFRLPEPAFVRIQGAKQSHAGPPGRRYRCRSLLWQACVRRCARTRPGGCRCRGAVAYGQRRNTGRPVLAIDLYPNAGDTARARPSRR